MAGGIVEKVGNNVYRDIPGLVRTSSIAIPGSLPNTWTVEPDKSIADDLVISESDLIQDMRSLQETFMYTLEAAYIK